MLNNVVIKIYNDRVIRYRIDGILIVKLVLTICEIKKNNCLAFVPGFLPCMEKLLLSNKVFGYTLVYCVTLLSGLTFQFAMFTLIEYFFHSFVHFNHGAYSRSKISRE